jgi:hypothetical protein
MTYGIDDLRRRLFETIDGVRSGAVSLDQARQISDLSQVIVNSAKVEVEYVKATEAAARSQFLEQPPAPPALPPAAQENPATPGNAIAGVTRHLLKG